MNKLQAEKRFQELLNSLSFMPSEVVHSFFCFTKWHEVASEFDVLRFQIELDRFCDDLGCTCHKPR